MTCQGCVKRVRSELLKTPGVEAAEVQLGTPQAVITMERHISTDRLQESVSKAGKYTITGIDNRMESQAAAGTPAGSSYYPIFLLFAYITGVTLLVQWTAGYFSWISWMQHFMAGFFLVFSFFKLMNLRGFAEGYGSYDIVAKAFPQWGFIYPFVELGLGIAFLTGIAPLGTNIATLVVMGVSAIGVARSLMKRTRFECACLGTVIRLPLSKVTLLEDLLMVAMSAVMILTMIN